MDTSPERAYLVFGWVIIVIPRESFGSTNGGLVTVNASERPRTSTMTVEPSSTDRSSRASPMP